MSEAVWPLAAHLAAVLALVGVMLGLAHVLGERHAERATGEPFESGIRPVAPARFAVPAKFYLVAALFVIFDVEVVYVIAWAVVAREAGWTGYVEILIFIGILIAALAYLWRVGALDWGRRRSRRPPPGHWTRPRAER